MNSNENSRASGGLHDVVFSTCSFLRSTTGRRAQIVRRALDSWQPLLDLPIGRRFFVDDRSPRASAIQVLGESAVGLQFDEIRFAPFAHPPHSNFGIVYSCGLGNSPYVLHLDDDVQVVATKSEVEEFLAHAIELLDANPELLGVNILTIDKPDGSQDMWKPAEPYLGDTCGRFAHPLQYFGTCASIIRRQLLERVGLDEIIAQGDKQLSWWERLVSEDTTQFLVATGPTPFAVDPEAWRATATRDRASLRFRAMNKWLESRDRFRSG